MDLNQISIGVNIILCVLSFILAAVSVILVILTIKQNNKMLEQNTEMMENSTRPYITICFETTHFGSPIGYFVARNYGSSSATITNCEYSENIKNHRSSFADIKTLLDCLNGTTLAPGQKYLVPFKLNEFNGELAIFDLVYTTGAKTYSEHVEINVSNYRKYIKPRANNSDHLKDISYAAQEIAERLM